jgi:hypothetical protein
MHDGCPGQSEGWAVWEASDGRWDDRLVAAPAQYQSLISVGQPLSSEFENSCGSAPAVRLRQHPDMAITAKQRQAVDLTQGANL